MYRACPNTIEILYVNPPDFNLSKAADAVFAQTGCSRHVGNSLGNVGFCFKIIDKYHMLIKICGV